MRLPLWISRSRATRRIRDGVKGARGKGRQGFRGYLESLEERIVLTNNFPSATISSRIDGLWAEVQSSDGVSSLIDINLAQNATITAETRTFATAVSAMSSSITSLKNDLTQTPRNFNDLESLSIDFGIGLEAGVSAGLKSVAEANVSLARGFSLSYDLLAAGNQDWTISRTFELSAGLGVGSAELGGSLASTYSVTLGSLRSNEVTDLEFAWTIEAGVESSTTLDLLSNSSLMKTISQWLPSIDLKAELAQRLGRAGSIRFATTMSKESFLSQYASIPGVSNPTLWQGLADVFVPGYGDSTAQNIASAALSYLPGGEAANVLLDLARKDTLIGILANNGSVELEASTASSVSFGVEAGIGLNLPINPKITANLGVTAGVDVSATPGDAKSFSLTLDTWSPIAGQWTIEQARQQLAGTSITGVTVVTHGFQPDIPLVTMGDSLMDLAQAIQRRSGGFLLDYDVPGEGGAAYFDAVQSIPPSRTIQLTNSPSGELVLLFDWAPESNESSSGWGEAAGDALFSTLVGLGVIDPLAGARNPSLHMIGHSFGSVVTSEAVERLLSFNIPVDHVTYLDPHDFDQDLVPIDGPQALSKVGQPVAFGYGATAWRGVGFTDVYYQTEFAPDGRPIPGAFNINVTDAPEVSPFPFPTPSELPHTDVWAKFYLGTVPDSRDQQGRSIGYAFSRIANSGTNQAQVARRAAETSFANWRFSEQSVAGHEHTTIPANQRAQFDSFRGEVQATSIAPINSGFSERGDGVVLPGWSHHGGGGLGQPVSEAGREFMRLNTAGASRTHNLVYVDPSAGYVIYDVRRFAFAGVGSDDEFVVRAGNFEIDRVRVSDLAGTWQTRRAILSGSAIGAAVTLTFAIDGKSNGVGSTVDIDTIALERGGLTGDVMTVDLASLWPGGNRFSLNPSQVAVQSLTDPNQTRTVRIEARTDVAAPRWRLWVDRLPIEPSNTPPKLIGELVLADDSSGELKLTRDAGRFHFAPGPDSVFGTSQPPGFQGIVRFGYSADRPGANGTSSSTGDRTLDLRIQRGATVASSFSKDGLRAVNGSSTILDRMEVQHRLNFLGSTLTGKDYGDQDGQFLAVDGIIGPKTTQAITKFNNDQINRPNLTTIGTDTIFRLNEPKDLVRTLSAQQRERIAEGLESAGRALASAASQSDTAINKPLDLVNRSESAIASLSAGRNRPEPYTISRLLSLPETLRNQFFGSLAEFFRTTPSPSTTGTSSSAFRSAPQALTSPSVEWLPESSATPGLERFIVRFTDNTSFQQSGLELFLDGGQGAASHLRTLTPGSPSSLTGSLDLTLDFSFDFSEGLAPEEAFKIAITSGQAKASLTESPTQLPILGLGLVQLQATSNDVAMTAGAHLELPSSTLTQLLNDPSRLSITPTSDSQVSGAISVTVAPYGAATSIAGTSSLTTTIDLTSLDAFGGGAPQISFGTNSAALASFANLDVGSLGAAFGQIGSFLDGLVSDEKFSARLPFSIDTRIGDLLNLRSLWQDQIDSVFRESESSPAPVSIQQVLNRLGTNIGGVTFDTASRRLTFNLNLLQRFNRTSTLAYEQNLGSLAGLTTSSPLSIRADVEGKLTIGIDLSSPLGSGFTLNSTTPLSFLNGPTGTSATGARGVQFVPGNDIRFTLSDGTVWDFDVNPATESIGSLINGINALNPPAVNKLQASLDTTGKRIVLTDKSKGTAGPFSVTALNDSLAGLPGVGLGIFATVKDPKANGDYEIVGRPLYSESLADRVYLVNVGNQAPSLRASVTATASDVEATARLGIVDIAIGNDATTTIANDAPGTIQANFNIQANLPTGPTQFTARQLIQGLREGQPSSPTLLDQSTVTFSGGANLSLPVRVNAFGTPVERAQGIQGTITWASGNATNGTGAITNPTVSFSFESGLTDVSLFDGVTPESVVQAIGDAVAKLSTFEQFSFVANKLPGLNKSLQDILGLTSDFQQAVAEFQKNPAVVLATLEESLETALERALGLTVTPGDGSGVEFSLPRNNDPINPEPPALKVAINFNTSPVDVTTSINLAGLGLEVPLLNELVDVRGSAAVQVKAQANIQVNVGIDLRSDQRVQVIDPQSPTGFRLVLPVFLYQESKIDLSLGARASNIFFTTTVGPFGLAIGNGGNDNGSIALDVDGLASTTNDPATFTIGLTGGTGGRVPLSSFGTSNLASSGVAGQLRATLPVYLADRTTPLNSSQRNLTFNGTLPSNLSSSLSFTTNAGQVFTTSVLTGLNPMAGFAGGWDSLFAAIDLAIDNADVIGKLPLLGPQLRDGLRFVGDLRDKVTDNLSALRDNTPELVQQRLFEALGPGGLNWLKDRNNDGVNVNDISRNTSGTTTSFTLGLRNNLAVVDVPLKADLSVLAGLGLKIDGGVRLRAGLDWTFTFGVDTSNNFGFFINPENDDLRFQVEATLPGLNANAKLGFLDVIARDNGSRVAAEFIVDLADPRPTIAGDRLRVGQIPGALGVRFGTNNEAKLNFTLEAGIGADPNVPRIRTDLLVDYSFWTGAAPKVELKKVGIDPGQFIRNVAGPVIDQISNTLDPIRPVLQVIASPIPVISDLAGRPFTMLDVAAVFGGLGQDDVNSAKRVINIASRIIQLADAAEALSSSEYIEIFDNVTLSDDVDIRTSSLSTVPASKIERGRESDPFDGNAALQSFVSAASSLRGDKPNSKGLEFPLLQKPLLAVQLLFGQDVDLVRFDMDPIDIGASFTESFWLIPPFLSAILGGRIGVRADFDFGLDTRGLLRTGNALDGFYVSDIDDRNVDGPELYVYAGLEAGAAFGGDLGIIKLLLGAVGGIRANVGFDLNNPDNDKAGKVYLDELLENLGRGFGSVFDTTGNMRAALTGFIKIEIDLGLFSITIVDAEKEIASATLLEFGRGAAAPPPATLAVRDGADLRLALNPASDDNFRVEQAGVSQIVVSSRGRRQIFDIGSNGRILGDAGAGNDTVIIDPSVTFGVSIDGGDGDDSIIGGSGRNTLSGGKGNDTLVGGGADDALTGGTGRDCLVGAGGNDTLNGETDSDILFGGTGNDSIEGGDGNDSIYGEIGDDSLKGGVGDDRVDGGLDNDSIAGDAGRDLLLGGDGRDTIRGGSESDTLRGDLGNDELYGDDGDDLLEGGSNNDSARGDRGDDTIRGDLGSDTIYGDDGNDVLYAGLSEAGGDVGSEHEIYGGGGNDTIYGDIGRDVLYGEGIGAEAGLVGNDLIFGNEGSDRIVGGWGRDLIYAVLGNPDLTRLSSDSHLIYGDLEIDPNSVVGFIGSPSDHADTIYGDGGDDTIRAGFGNDELYGLRGNDWLEGGWQADTIWAGTTALGSAVAAAGEVNTIFGDVDNDAEAPFGGSPFSDEHRDLIVGDVGRDTVRGGYGGDVIRTLGGADLVFGGFGDDQINLGDGDDVAFGEDGSDTILAGLGLDTVDGGENDDSLMGEAGDDFLIGGRGSDQVSGGTGRDMIWGGSAFITTAEFVGIVARNEFALPTNFLGAEWSDTVGMVALVPIVLAGLSVEGAADDGADTLRGDGDGDWIFGGGSQDRLEGGDGDDYLDAGSGEDFVFGDAGQDIVRGGSGNDTIYGGIGIDQLFGDADEDYLYGDAGDAAGSLVGQRLFGGDGIDYLHGFSSITVSVDNYRNPSFATKEWEQRGEDLFGGSGGDWIYGSLRRESIYGGGGNDTVFADALGAQYATLDVGNTPRDERALIGGADTIFGDSGEDKLYGGGGNDIIWGGFDSDWLEGQNGVDTVFGGSAIDMILLDVDASYDALPNNSYERFDGHRGNRVAGDVPDDNATDILLVQGTGYFDTILVSQGAGNRLQVDYETRDENGVLLNPNRTIRAYWRDNGVPLVEQFRISGLGGNDRIEFVEGPNRLDVSDLDSRSRDWVGVVDAGPGDDTVRGTGARDRIDGGRGSDVIFGFAGDDQLWGDNGPGAGNSGDRDIIYGGAGNDDIIGGQGTNALFAWSRDPNSGFAQLGFEDGQSASSTGTSVSIQAKTKAPTSGKLTQDLRLNLYIGADAPRVVWLRQAVTADNNSLSGLVTDLTNALGAAGLSGLVQASLTADGFLVLTLNSSTPGTSLAIRQDFGVFVDSSGTLFDAPGTGRKLEDTGLNRTLGGKNTDQLYGGTGLDFLYGFGAPRTQPDELFDQRGKKFEQRDGGVAGDAWKEYAKSTDKVWYYGGTNLNDFITVDYVTEPGPLQDRHLITRLTENNGAFTFDAQVKLDFNAVDDKGNRIWNPGDNFFGPAVTGSVNAPDNGRLTVEGDQTSLSLSLTLGGGNVFSLTLPVITTADNKDLRDLVRNLNEKINQTEGLQNKIAARIDQGRISLVLVNPDQPSALLSIVAANSIARNQLGFADGQVAVQGFVGREGVASLLPPEGDYLAIIVDALRGNDTVKVGPTVTKSVWTDAGEGDDRVEYLSGKPIFTDIADGGVGSPNPGRRNDLFANAFDLKTIDRGQLYVGLTIDNPADVDWFKFKVNPSNVPNLSITSLSPEDRIALELFRVDSNNLIQITAPSVSGSLDLSGLSPTTEYLLKVSTDRVPTVYQLAFLGSDWAEPSSETNPRVLAGDTDISKVGLLTDLTLVGSDEDWFQFTIPTRVASENRADRISVVRRDGDVVTLELLNKDTKQPIAGVTPAVTNPSSRATLDLKDVPAGDYVLRVRRTPPSGSTPANFSRYDLETSIGKDPGTLVLSSLSAPVLLPTSGPDWAESNDTSSTAFALVNQFDILNYGLITDLSIDKASDQDYFRFVLPTESRLDNARIDVIVKEGDAVELSLLNANGIAVTVNNNPIVSQNVSANRLTLALSGVPGGEYILRVRRLPALTTPFSFTRYDLIPRLSNNQGTAVLYRSDKTDSSGGLVDLGSRQLIVRRDVLLGSDGNDSLSGGSYEDWIFGGQGNDVLTGGKDRQAGDLIWGEEGDDIFQVVTDQLPLLTASERMVGSLDQRTFVPTFVDRFAGGDGNDQVLFLGGNLDPRGEAIPDNVAIKYNTILHRHEFTNRVWDYQKRQWAIDQRTGDFRQDYAYYQALEVESTVIDVQAGNDEVHAEPEYKIPGTSPSGTLEWGIPAGAIPQGATPGLIIRGGIGNDLLFGGAGNDTIDGGPGADVIRGGSGNDRLIGGDANDWIAGGPNQLTPDRYEYLSGDKNDDSLKAALIAESLDSLRRSPAEPVIIRNLSLTQGDVADWYILRTPEAVKSFGPVKAAQVLKTSITASTTDVVLKLIAGRDTDPTPAGLNVVPVEQFDGVPEYYLIQVTRRAGLTSSVAVNYELTFAPSLASTIQMGPSSFAGTSNQYVAIESPNLSDRPVVLPLATPEQVKRTFTFGTNETRTFTPGDINADGFADFIAAASQSTGSVRVHFGSSTIDSSDLKTPDVELVLPNSLLGSPASQVISGDFNADGYADIAVTGYDGGKSYVYLLMGRPTSEWAKTPRLDVKASYDVRIEVGNSDPINIANGGDIDGGAGNLFNGDDLLVGRPSHTNTGVGSNQGVVYVIPGFKFQPDKPASSWEYWAGSKPVLEDLGNSLTSPGGFALVNIQTNPSSENLWKVSGRRANDAGHSGPNSFYFGNNDGTNIGTYQTGGRVGGRIQRTLDLTSVVAGAKATLSFNYFLETERSASAGYDVARVLAWTTDPNNPPAQANFTVLASNRAGNGELLVDGGSGWREWMDCRGNPSPRSLHRKNDHPRL